MNMKRLLLLSILLLGAASAHAAPRPNFLLIIGDDIGIDVTSSLHPGLIDGLLRQYGPRGHNHPDYRMIAGRPASIPVLDRLARQGMVFSQAWAQPFCSPTRASLLTGLNAAKTGVLDYTGYVSQNQHSFVRDLRDKGGYSTAVFGKWHMAGLAPAGADPKTSYRGMKPKEAGFDLFLGNLNGAPSTYWDYDYHVQDATTPASDWRTEKPPQRSLPGIAPTTFASVVQVADAAEWITAQERANPDKPWFTWLAFNLAHISEQQQPNPMVVPNLDTLDETSRREMQACGGSFGSAHVGNCSGEALMRAMTNSMDTVIGKLLDVVDRLDPNTYVIYISDNGTWMMGPPNRDFIDNLYITRRGRSKGTGYESGVRVSMVVRGKGIAAGSRSNVPVDTMDLYATILDLAGLKAAPQVPDRSGTRTVALDSVSLTPLLLRQARRLRDPDRGYLLAETINPLQRNLRQAAARNTRYKLICNDSATPEACVFFDLVDDPLEEYPLAKPASCAGYSAAARSRDKAWHFCRLLEVVGTESFIAAAR
jgi:arylsulfatase A-like enzyme